MAKTNRFIFPPGFRLTGVRKEPKKYPRSFWAFVTMRRDGFEGSVRIGAWRGRAVALAMVDGIRIDSCLSMNQAIRAAKNGAVSKLMRMYADAIARSLDPARDADARLAEAIDDASLSRTKAERPLPLMEVFR